MKDFLEQPNQNPEISLDERVKLRKLMQVAMAEKFYGFSSGEKLLEWIDKYPKDFGDTIDSLQSEKNIDLVAIYKNDPERALLLAEDTLYAKQPSKFNQNS
ncbi:MAG: hypothetical protein Q8P86_02550 [bacterium]|nr:hypothetical protein [bacterium]